jgi:hypothetical protein
MADAAILSLAVFAVLTRIGDGTVVLLEFYKLQPSCPFKLESTVGEPAII